ncbi:N-alpha-acetyltransferase 30 [Lemmus lemmus]
MAEVPPGPSSLLPPPAPAAPAAAEPRCPFPAGAALACCSDDEEDDEEHEGGCGSPAGGEAASTAKARSCLHCPQLPPEQPQQLNGLIGPELRHLRAAATLKSKVPEAVAAASDPAAARNGLVEGNEPEEEEEDEQVRLLASALTAGCSLRSSLGREAEPGEDRTIRYVRYESELQMPDIMRLITKDLSEPYSIYTYRYFIHNWPQLCFLAMVGEECVGAIVCKLDMHKKMFRRGYIAMLAVDSKYRRNGIGTNLVKKAIYAMVEGDCDEVVLETEITNKSALKLYENLGFVRDKRLFRYYLNGVDALRLKLWLR